MTKPRESVIEGYFCDRADELGVFHRKLVWYGRRFAPDRLALYQGLVMFVEFKTERGVLSHGQRHEIGELQQHGGLVHVLKSTSDVDRFFDELIACTEK